MKEKQTGRQISLFASSLMPFKQNATPPGQLMTGSHPDRGSTVGDTDGKLVVGASVGAEDGTEVVGCV